MRIEDEIIVECTLERAWDVLSDTASYPQWNPLTVRVEGPLTVGSLLTLHVNMGGRKMVRKHRLSRFDENEAIAWTIVGPQWLMNGERTQSLEDLGDGRVAFRNVEIVEGLVGPLVELAAGKMVRKGINRVSRKFKERCEAVSS